LNTEGYPTQNAGEGEMFEAGQSGQDGLQGMEMNEMGPDQNVGGSRKRKRKTPKTLDQSEIELKKAAHVSKALDFRSEDTFADSIGYFIERDRTKATPQYRSGCRRNCWYIAEW
jgi:hypothetical protein